VQILSGQAIACIGAGVNDVESLQMMLGSAASGAVIGAVLGSFAPGVGHGIGGLLGFFFGGNAASLGMNLYLSSQNLDVKFEQS